MSFNLSDVLRVLAVIGLVPATIGDGAIGFAVMFLVVGGCMLPRALGVPPWLDALMCSSFIFAAWAALLDWYVSYEGLDLAVHAASTGLIGILASQVAQRARLLAPSGHPRERLAVAVATVSSAGLLATVWEIGEWIGYTYFDDAIQVGYDDTITDLIAGILGAGVAGLLAGAAVPRRVESTMPR
ncbi:hypothetical protein [Blastococcus sp. Marseille-P5729]|uniref:hypothetical protein n=1 Tax=Blastococcus sp. Marseille-P5729 TaxID=2086582 RepID=UPI000D0F9648|nr:hypothetical protein [Blastococcus sp. Marseille-P5729]